MFSWMGGVLGVIPLKNLSIKDVLVRIHGGDVFISLKGNLQQ